MPGKPLGGGGEARFGGLVPRFVLVCIFTRFVTAAAEVSYLLPFIVLKRKPEAHRSKAPYHVKKTPRRRRNYHDRNAREEDGEGHDDREGGVSAFKLVTFVGGIAMHHNGGLLLG